MTATPIAIAEVRARLDAAQVFEHLAEFDPRWVGSIPLDIHGPEADADICCSAGDDLDGFAAHLEACFGSQPGFRVHPNTHADEASIIAYFSLKGLPVEVYGRKRPVETHESYIHWLAEHRLLGLAEDRLRQDVREAKATGLKTEPAFGKCLQLGSDPYIELLKLASPGDQALRQIIRAAGYQTR